MKLDTIGAVPSLTLAEEADGEARAFSDVKLFEVDVNLDVDTFGTDKRSSSSIMEEEPLSS